jgi:transposase
MDMRANRTYRQRSEGDEVVPHGGQSEIHQSETLVRWVAEREGISPETLGIKGTSRILHSMKSRVAFLHDPTHQVVFHYTPKHASWMNQVEIWLSILVRKLLNRGLSLRWTICVSRFWLPLRITTGRWLNPSSRRTRDSPGYI